MRALTTWNYTPFTRLHEREKEFHPYVCRLAPFLGGFCFEWFDRGSTGAHKVLIRKRGSDDPCLEYALDKRDFTITGLEKDETYEFTVWRTDMSACSATRLVRTGFSRGTVINYIHPEDKFCEFSGVCPSSPSIIKLPSGKLIASMDILYGTTDEKITPLFESYDHGATWHYLTELYPLHWGKLFLHNGKLYAIGESGSCMTIGCSEDEGKTWSRPVSLMQGAKRDWACHKSATPVVTYNGRLYVAFEYGAWRFKKFYHGLLSVKTDADLMDPANWCLTEPAAIPKELSGINAEYVTACEGNAVVLKDGIGIMLRADPFEMPTPDEGNKAFLVRGDVNDPERACVFDRVVEMPCGQRSKFAVYSEPNGLGYVAICNEYAEGHRLRSLLTMAVSEDCIHWRKVHRIIDARGDETPGKEDVAYSDPDFAFDGDDILIVTRTASNCAMDFHNNNMVCFHKVENYKQFFA